MSAGDGAFIYTIPAALAAVAVLVAVVGSAVNPLYAF